MCFLNYLKSKNYTENGLWRDWSVHSIYIIGNMDSGSVHDCIT